MAKSKKDKERTTIHYTEQERIQDFKLGGGGALKKKLRRAEGSAKNFGLFRMKNHNFTPKNHIFFSFRGEGGTRRVRPPLIRPCRKLKI
jgi:hypothetical protein